MADNKRIGCLRRRCFITTCLVLLCLPLVLTAASTDFTPTEPTLAVATTNPVVRRPSNIRYVESSENEEFDYEESSPQIASSYPTLREPFFSPPQLLMTLMRTVVDVLNIVNEKRRNHKRTIKKPPALSPATMNITGKAEYAISDNLTMISNASSSVAARGMDHEISYDDDPHVHPPEAAPLMPMTEAPTEVMKQSRYTDPWEGYYEFIITEGSFKFWSAFQLVTAALLLYSALAAIYYAKFNPIQPDYDTTYDDYFFGRSLEGAAPAPAPGSAAPAPGWLSGLSGMGRAAYQRVMDAIHEGEEQFA